MSGDDEAFLEDLRRRINQTIEKTFEQQARAIAEGRGAEFARLLTHGSLPSKDTMGRISDLRDRLAKFIGRYERQSDAKPPALGRRLILFLIPADRQEEVLGDFEERFTKRWLPELGPMGARWCYVWNVLMSSAALARIGIMGAVFEWLWKVSR